MSDEKEFGGKEDRFTVYETEKGYLDFRATVEGQKPMAEVTRVNAQARVVEAYAEGFRRRYGKRPVIMPADRTILEIVARSAGEHDALELIEEFFLMNNEWFLKTNHSTRALSTGLSHVMASLGQKTTAKMEVSHAKIRDNVSLFIEYVFDFGVLGVAFIPYNAKKLPRIVDEKELSSRIEFSGHTVDKATAEEILSEHKNRNLTYGDVTDIFISALCSRLGIQCVHLDKQQALAAAFLPDRPKK